MNFVICLVLIYVIALIWGLPNLHPPTQAIVGETACVAPEITPGKVGNCTGPGPAALAGIRAGDVVVKVGDTQVSTFEDMAAAVRKLHGTVPVVVERDGTPITTYVDVTPTQRFVGDGRGRLKPGRDRRCHRGRRASVHAHALQRAHRHTRPPSPSPAT